MDKQVKEILNNGLHAILELTRKVAFFMEYASAATNDAAKAADAYNAAKEHNIDVDMLNVLDSTVKKTQAIAEEAKQNYHQYQQMKDILEHHQDYCGIIEHTHKLINEFHILCAEFHVQDRIISMAAADLNKDQITHKYLIDCKRQGVQLLHHYTISQGNDIAYVDSAGVTVEATHDNVRGSNRRGDNNRAVNIDYCNDYIAKAEEKIIAINNIIAEKGKVIDRLEARIHELESAIEFTTYHKLKTFSVQLITELTLENNDSTIAEINAAKLLIDNTIETLINFVNSTNTTEEHDFQ